jgi:hypothetical protein
LVIGPRFIITMRKQQPVKLALGLLLEELDAIWTEHDVPDAKLRRLAV